jgi:integrase
VMMPRMPGKDTKTRYQGVYARHQQSCKTSESGKPRDCNCSPRYYGVVWDRLGSRTRKTKRFPQVSAARNARQELADGIADGTTPTVTSPKLGDAVDEFIKAANEGVALNKWGRQYRRRAVTDLESALQHIPERLRGRRLSDVRRGDIQRIVDQLSAKGLSGSRIRSVVNAIRSLYRWAQDRELATHDPASLVRLPAMAATARDRVATPAEFARLLTAVALKDAIPYALAGYATARHQEIRTLDWSHVNLKLGAIELAADEEGRKPGGSWRVVPLVKPLRAMLRRVWISQGRPAEGKVCPPRNKAESGLIALHGIQRRLRKEWRALEMEPIGFHEARHTAATWLDHAGVSPKVASQLMGHKTPEYQPGAASITLRRYTHTLPGELERARDQLDVFLLTREQQEKEALAAS